MGVPIPRIMPRPKVIDDPITKDERLMDLLATYHPVVLDEEGNYSERLTWCLEHCQSKFRDIKMTKGRVWFFQNEKDATMFAMKWS
jgi:hypothetical protein